MDEFSRGRYLREISIIWGRRCFSLLYVQWSVNFIQDRISTIFSMEQNRGKCSPSTFASNIAASRDHHKRLLDLYVCSDFLRFLFVYFTDLSPPLTYLFRTPRNGRPFLYSLWLFTRSFRNGHPTPPPWIIRGQVRSLFSRINLGSLLFFNWPFCLPGICLFLPLVYQFHLPFIYPLL